MAHSRLRSISARQDGVALVVAIGVLLVMGVIAAGVATATVAGKNETSGDSHSARALAAAESGLRLGTLYLNEATPLADGLCPGTGANAVAATTVAVNGRCGPYTVAVPTGGSATFTISAGAASPIACSGAQVAAPTRPQLTIHQRCITSTGSVAGSARRVQIRVASASFIFPIPGILGINDVKIGQGAGSSYTLAQCASPATLPNGTGEIIGSVGTNGVLSTSLGCWIGDPSDAPSNSNSSRLYIGQGAPTTVNGVPNPSLTGAQPGGIINLGTPLSLPSIESLFWTGQDGATDTSLPAGNNNLAGIHAAASCSGAAYTAATRVLALPNNGCTVTLDGSADIDHPAIYDFCGMSLPNNGVLSITDPTNLPYVRVFLDSSARLINGAPACPAGTSGTLTMGNGSGILANATSSLGAQIFIYGAPSGSAPATLDADGVNGNFIAWRNSANVKMLLVAPHARVVFQNGGAITGGLAAYAVEANNNMQFIWDEAVDHVQRRALYYRTSYAECQRTPPDPANPDSGC
jgi:Tfp pilus assembly protein PilX